MQIFKRALLLLALVALLGVTAAAADGDAISQAEIGVTVSDQGVATVAASVTIRFTSAVTELSLPVGQDVQDVAVQGFDAKTVTEKGFVSLNVTGNFLGEQTFLITYTTPTTLTVGENGQSLRLALFSARWPYPVESFHYTLTMPKTFSGAPVLESGYYGELAPAQVVTNLSELHADGAVTYAMLDHESMAMTVAVDAGYFPEKSPIFGGGVPWELFSPILFALAALYYILFLRAPLPARQISTHLLEPVTAGDLPAVLWGGAGDMAALIARWGCLGYLQVATDPRGRAVLVRKMAMGNERREQEQRLFERLFGGEKVVYLGGARQRSTAVSGGKLLAAYWRRRLFDPKSGNPAVLTLLGALSGAVTLGRIFVALFGTLLSPILWAVLGALCGLFVGIVVARGMSELLRRQSRDLVIAAAVLVGLTLILGTLCGLFGAAALLLVQLLLTGAAVAFGGRRTRAGIEQLARTLGYRRYLAGLEPRQAVRLMRTNPQFFYETLPAAERLGIGRKFTAKFEGLRLERCAWLPGADTAAQFRRRYLQLLNQLDPEAHFALRAERSAERSIR